MAILRHEKKRELKVQLQLEHEQQSEHYGKAAITTPYHTEHSIDNNNKKLPRQKKIIRQIFRSSSCDSCEL